MNEALTSLQPYAGIALGLVLGLLIGIERGWSHRLEPDGSRVAGVRTFALLGLAGGIAGVAATLVSPLVGSVLLLAAASAMVIGYARGAAPGELSATTTVVALITLGVGMLAATGQMVLASVAAAVTTLILTERRRLHDWIGRLNEEEVHAIARFGLIALAILPLLPDREYGPLGAWNPRQIWTVVVLVCGLSLVAYAASKRLGASKGMLATAAAGAVVSSTAVTAALATRIRKGEADEAPLVAGIALASAMMCCRVMILVAVLAPFALPGLALVTVPAALVGAGYVLWLLRRSHGAPASPAAAPVRNPFDLGPALLLAALVMAISVAGRWALKVYGEAGLATALGISGMMDVDAAIITMSGLPPGSLSVRTAGLVLAAPILANTLVKAGLALAIARGRAGWRAASPLLSSLAAALAGVSALWLLFPK